MARRPPGWLALLCLAGCMLPVRGEVPETAALPSPTGPPMLEVQSHGLPIPVVGGSMCWTRESVSLCADSVPPTDLAATVTAPRVSPGSTLALSYESEPLPGSVEVSRWVDSEPVPVALAPDRTIRAPDQPGIHVFSVFARWSRGDATHAFRIEVQP